MVLVFLKNIWPYRKKYMKDYLDRDKIFLKIENDLHFVSAFDTFSKYIFIRDRKFYCSTYVNGK